MIDFSSVPSSSAKPLNGDNILIRSIPITFTDNMDERYLYNELNNRLTILETSLEINKK